MWKLLKLLTIQELELCPTFNRETQNFQPVIVLHLLIIHISLDPARQWEGENVEHFIHNWGLWENYFTSPSLTTPSSWLLTFFLTQLYLFFKLIDLKKYSSEIETYSWKLTASSGSETMAVTVSRVLSASRVPWPWLREILSEFLGTWVIWP